jgi:hypothetical protein
MSYLMGDELHSFLAGNPAHHAGNIVKLYCPSTHHFTCVCDCEQRGKGFMQLVWCGSWEQGPSYCHHVGPKGVSVGSETSSVFVALPWIGAHSCVELGTTHTYIHPYIHTYIHARGGSPKKHTSRVKWTWKNMGVQLDEWKNRIKRGPFSSDNWAYIMQLREFAPCQQRVAPRTTGLAFGAKNPRMDHRGHLEPLHMQGVTFLP